MEIILNVSLPCSLAFYFNHIFFKKVNFNLFVLERIIIKLFVSRTLNTMKVEYVSGNHR